MKKTSPVKSGFVTLRNLFGVLFCVAGLCLATFTLSAKQFAKQTSSTKSTKFQPVHPRSGQTTPATGPAPTGGALSVSNPKLTYTDPIGPVPNATGEGVTGAPVCAMNGVDCSNYVLTLDPSIFSAASGYDPTKANIVIQLSWSPSAFQYGSFVEDKNGNVIASNTAGLEPETITIAVSTANLQENGPCTILTTLVVG